ncbi:MAG: aminotransferase class V-fold PLP-dependent enzyme [Spirochaetales bacterium]|nr:aminotransferase class V-fold PLP-dependent enzyme [Spirochaetales bacterium]
MYSFKNDYTDGGHPRVLEALAQTANRQEEGYGEDSYCGEAKALLRDLMDKQEADIHFLAGGTLTNLTVLSAFLRPHEAVIAAKEGHISVHETGAIEATGHKILPLETADGKITVEGIESVLAEHEDEHMVKPKLVYISQSTETGTLYGLDELEALRACCDRKGLILYMDGARLGSALCSSQSDMTLMDVARLCDAFYVGGTKNGALFGEALVICREKLKEDFRYLIKQRGALLAKGRLLGVQFLALFKGGLYFDLAKGANEKAADLQRRIGELGFPMKFHSCTNQIFPILPEKVIQRLEESYSFYRWEALEDRNFVIRLVCSWHTEEEAIDRFVEDLKGAMG